MRIHNEKTKNIYKMISSIKYKTRILSVAFLTIFLNAFATVKLPAIFSDHMVLQLKTKVAIWGWAKAGEEILITSAWGSDKPIRTIASASGNWKILMPTPAAGGPYTLIIKGENTIELKDILIGEVWVCSGQSNMVFSLKASYKAKEEIVVAEFPQIRYFSVKRQYGPEEFKDCPGSVWEKTSPETAPSFSAVAYYFASKIHRQLNVPVGIVYAAWGGTPAEAWTPNSILRSDDALSLNIKRWKEMYATVGKDSIAYHLALDTWEKQTSAKGVKIKKPEEPGTLISYNRPWREPSVLFNGMINPVIPFSIKGVLWYQGESNVNYAGDYYHLFSSMIRGWRERWHDQNLPFYFVQIAPFNYSKMDAAAQLRDAQYQVSKNIPNTGMAVTVDLGDMKDQHFTHKKEVGERLALIALTNDYGNKKINYKGAEVKNAVVEKGKIFLEFSSSALKAGSDTLKGFEIGYRTSSGEIVFVNAKAKIEGRNVVVWNDDHNDPVEVRYAWLLAGEANLFDGEARPDGMVGRGLPAFPFTMKINNKKK